MFIIRNVVVAEIAGSVAARRVRRGLIGLALLSCLFAAGLPEVGAQTNGDFRYSSDGSVVTITKYLGKGGSVIIPDEVDGKPVTIIGSAFQSCTNLIAVTIPQSVTNICQNAFYYCPSLASVNIPTRIVKIGECAFASCHSLTNLEIDPDNPGYSSIDGALFDKARTTLLQCPGGKTGTYVVPSSVKSIGPSAFGGCDRLLSVVISSGVTNIGYDAFSWCFSVTNITIPSSVTTIGLGAFWDCHSLRDIAIPKSVASIPSEAFSGCKSLVSISLPESITWVGSAAFRDCTNLASIFFVGNAPKLSTWPTFSNTAPGFTIFYRPFSSGFTSPTWNGVAAASYYSSRDLTYAATNGGLAVTGFSGNATLAQIPAVLNGTNVIAIGNGAFASCFSLTRASIPNGVTDIGANAFSSCRSLASVTIPNSVTNIGPGAFESCSALTNVTIGKGVLSIGASAFSGCSKLGNIILPTSVTEIDSWAFSSCTGLTNVYFLGDAPETFRSSVFQRAASSFTICYREGAGGFTTPTWNGYPTILKPVNHPVIGIRAKGVLWVRGEPGSAMRIEYSDQLGNGAPWKPLTNFNSSDTATEYADPDATNTTVRFYRVIAE